MDIDKYRANSKAVAKILKKAGRPLSEDEILKRLNHKAAMKRLKRSKSWFWKLWAYLKKV